MNKLRLLNMAFAACALAACGGGDGDGTPTPSPAPNPPPPPPAQAQALPTVVNGKARLLAGSLTGECGDVARHGAMAFHEGELWLAEIGCDGSSRVQIIDPDTGVVRTHAQVKSDPEAARATGFRNPTGLVVLDRENAFVADAADQVVRWRQDGLPKPPVPGHSAGIWKINPASMQIFAGVIPTEKQDGEGESIGFGAPNGLTNYANGIALYTKDGDDIRVITSPTRLINPTKVVVYGRGKTQANAAPLIQGDELIDYVVIERDGGYWLEITGGASYDHPATRLPGNGRATAFSDGYLFTSDLNDAPEIPDAVTIHGGVFKRSGNSEFKPAVENVQYLSSFVVDDKANLYIQQRNAIVKVEFDSWPP